MTPGPASTARKALARLRGRPIAAPVAAPEPASPADAAIIERCRPYTMTGEPRVQAVIDAVRYCHARGVPGAFAECGVWRGGSVLAMLLTLQDIGTMDRDVYLYDTFEGMTEPSEADTSRFDGPASEIFATARAEGRVPFDYLFQRDDLREQDVLELLTSTGYPAARIHTVAGAVEETLPAQAPEELALLRLDTDWYESTRHELAHLYDRLAPGGVLIIDDYGHWDGARRAVDEFFAERPPLLLSRIDYSARIAVKL